MARKGINKSVTFQVHSTTFGELQIYSKKNDLLLSEVYKAALDKYLADCTPGRLKVFAAPGAGKRIRINLSDDLYIQLVEKRSSSGHNLNDIIYPAIEILLNDDLKQIAA